MSDQIVSQHDAGERVLFEEWAAQRHNSLVREGCGYADEIVHNAWLGWLARAPLDASTRAATVSVDVAKATVGKSLLRPAISATNPLPPGCYCKPGRCAAPVIMGRQTPCRDPEKRDGTDKGRSA